MNSSDNAGIQQGATAHWTGITSGFSKGSTQLILSGTTTAGTVIQVGSLLVLNQCDTGFTAGALAAACTGSLPSPDNGGYYHCQDAWRATNQGCAVPSEGGVNSWRNNASEFEVVVVTAINQNGCGANCITLSKPIEEPDWAAGVQAAVIQPLPFDGIENLSLDSGFLHEGIGMTNTLHCWVSGVRDANADPYGIHMQPAFGSLIKDNYFYGVSATAGDKAGVNATGGANNLFQNNICQNTHMCFFVGNAAPETNDVYAYNFVPTVGQGGTNAPFPWISHAAGSSQHLFEGNAMMGENQDGDHGAQPFDTVFRNFLWAFYSCASGNCGAGGHAAGGINATPIRLFYGARYDNIIGNVLGTPGFSTTYKTFGAFDNAAIYIWGAGQAMTVNGTFFNMPTDSLVDTTTMLWGNYDVVNGAVRFNSSEVPTAAPTYPNPVPANQTLPASFYLSSKPSWFGSIPWPAVGPDVSSGNVGQCAGTFDTAGKFNGLAATSSSQCAGSALNTAWAGHVNANPAMACYFTMGGLPDGTGPALSFNGSACYGTSSSSSPNPPPPTNPAPNPPTRLVVTVN